MTDRPRPVVYSTLFAQDAQSPYLAMVVLLIISLRRINARIPCVVFDYSPGREAGDRLAAWQDALPFEIRRLHCEALRHRFEPRHVWSLRYDAPLHVAPGDPSGDVFIHFDADTLCLRDPAELAAGEFDYRLPVIPFERLKIGDWLAVFDLRKTNARRVLALARALDQEPHVWRPLDPLSSRRHDYPTSDSCMEVAVQLLGHRGHLPLDAGATASYLLHYARHEAQHYEMILAAARDLLAETGHRERFEREFGPLQPLIYRETSGYRNRTLVIDASRPEQTIYADDLSALVPLRNVATGAAGSAGPAEHWNETARLLWHLADGTAGVGAIAASIAGALATPTEAVQQDALAFYLERWREGRVRFAPRVSRGAPPTPRRPDFPILAVVLGLPASGTHCLAGALHVLGVQFGCGLDPMQGPETGDFSRLCDQALPAPGYRRALSPHTVVQELSRGFDALRRAQPRASHIGASHPSAIALVPEIEAAYPGPIRYLHIDRPLELCLMSTIPGEPPPSSVPDPAPFRNRQIALWELKQVVLASRPNLTIDYQDLLARPEQNLYALMSFLDLKLTCGGIDDAKAYLARHISAGSTSF